MLLNRIKHFDITMDEGMTGQNVGAIITSDINVGYSADIMPTFNKIKWVFRLLNWQSSGFDLAIFQDSSESHMAVSLKYLLVIRYRRNQMYQFFKS